MDIQSNHSLRSPLEAAAHRLTAETLDKVPGTDVEEAMVAACMAFRAVWATPLPLGRVKALGDALSGREHSREDYLTALRQLLIQGVLKPMQQAMGQRFITLYTINA